MTQGKKVRTIKDIKEHSKSEIILLNKVNVEFESKKNKGLNLKVLESKDKNLKVLECKDKELRMQESKVSINSKQDKPKNQSSDTT